ncbi:hypothetical protein [Thermoactinomyces sp. DSM 45891]|uniref:hypothetical protein n=1 Tax=Thermoactinomyces sp. DSM 45891 TaxID=1761907 RepID=UPI0009312A8F|nr:hypothetical protein [Thermoactinomyces sp. DSM 45891]
MNITIENGQYIYISFLKRNGFGIVEDTYLSVNCCLLFDDKNNWIGLEVSNENFNGPIQLPPLKEIEFPMHEAIINESGRTLEILFDKDLQVARKIKYACNIDVISEQLYGIEILLLDQGSIGNRDIVKPFVSSDS